MPQHGLPRKSASQCVPEEDLLLESPAAWVDRMILLLRQRADIVERDSRSDRIRRLAQLLLHCFPGKLPSEESSVVLFDHQTAKLRAMLPQLLQTCTRAELEELKEVMTQLGKRGVNDLGNSDESRCVSFSQIGLRARLSPRNYASARKDVAISDAVLYRALKTGVIKPALQDLQAQQAAHVEQMGGRDTSALRTAFKYCTPRSTYYKNVQKESSKLQRGGEIKQPLRLEVRGSLTSLSKLDAKGYYCAQQHRGK